jgi:hypothetical protein
VLLVTALGADVDAHVLDDAEDGDIHLLEHLQALARVDQRDVLWRGDDHGAGHRHLLRQRQLDVAGARRHVDDQVIEIAPVGLAEQLVERLGHHRTAPDHRRLDIDHEADRHRLQAVGLQRLHALAVVRLRLLAGQAQHLRLRRAIDVGIQNTDTGAFLGQRQGQIDRRRALADAALAGGHGNDVLDARHQLDAQLHRWATILLNTLADTLPTPGRVRTAAITCLRMASICVLAG